MNNKLIKVSLDGQDFIEFENGKVRFSGCLAWMDLLKSYKNRYGLKIELWPTPQGNSHEEILLRQFIQVFLEQWEDVDPQSEVCHCRNITYKKIDDAIIRGSKTIDELRRVTSANTACGTCASEIEKMIIKRIV